MEHIDPLTLTKQINLRCFRKILQTDSDVGRSQAVRRSLAGDFGRSGPAEIISPGLDGVLVPVDRVDALAGSLDALMANGADRRRMGAAAAASAERFRAEGVAEQWIGLLRSASAWATAFAPSHADEPQFASER